MGRSRKLDELFGRCREAHINALPWEWANRSRSGRKELQLTVAKVSFRWNSSLGASILQVDNYSIQFNWKAVGIASDQTTVETTTAFSLKNIIRGTNTESPSCC